MIDEATHAYITCSLGVGAVSVMPLSSALSSPFLSFRSISSASIDPASIPEPVSNADERLDRDSIAEKLLEGAAATSLGAVSGA